MREIYFRPTRLKQLAGIAGGVVLALGMSLPGAVKNEPKDKTVTDLYPESAWGQCDPSLWEHVHGADQDGIPGPDRLKIIEPCIEITGKLMRKIRMEDGDYHLDIKLDPAFFNITLDYRFEGNNNFQEGNLVTELICAFPKAKEFEEGKACEGFSQKIDLSGINVGDQVRVMGSYVYDNNPNGQHGWLEIHPITSVEKVNQ